MKLVRLTIDHLRSNSIQLKRYGMEIGIAVIANLIGDTCRGKAMNINA